MTMLSLSPGPWRLAIREALGLDHEPQVVAVPLPPALGPAPALRDEDTGALFPVQPSRREAGRGFVRLALAPHQALSLVPASDASAPAGAAAVEEDGARWIVGNGRFALELRGGGRPDGPGGLGGPVARLRIGSGPWRGGTFFDTARTPLRCAAEWMERGPLRTVSRHRTEFSGGGFHEMTVTVDAGADFARIDEAFSLGAADQLVWAFAGPDLPERIALLDSTAGQAEKALHYHLDQRHARLWCWTQYSQLHDLSDGFAIHFADGGAAGVVALDGGAWRGNALNHLEAWTRRWEPADPATRRLPAAAKADSFPGPDRIPARGTSACAPCFTLEGWLRRGARSFALVLSTAAALAPGAASPDAAGGPGCSVVLGHFEEVPDRARYRAQQGRLRRIHVRHGVLPLQAQLAMTFAWGEEGEAETPGRAQALRLAQEHLALPAPAADPDRIAQLDLFLQARLFGFWEGSGLAYSNCVVGRRVGPEMLRANDLLRRGKIDAATRARWRARFAFLAYLNASPHAYPGAATMEPLGAPDAVEPTLAGMANQNFYTDMIALAGFAAEAFPGHPEAAAWRELFGAHWARQMEYHVWPESGLWEESHTYYQHVLATLLPLLLRRRETGPDPFADPALQRLVGSALLQVTPRDAAFGGRRHLVAFGDHGVDVGTYRPLWPGFARAFASHAPELAARLAWLGAEMGAAVPDGIVPAAPAWASGPVQGLGFFFRGADAEGRESLLALRCGPSWAHHHNDEGSLQFFARGRALLVDSAWSQPQERGERKVAASGHSLTAGEGIDPLHYLWRFHRGWIVDSRATGPLAYAVAGVPVYSTWPRGLEPQLLRRAAWALRIVVELAPAAYLVADFPDCAAHRTRFHVARDGVAAEGNAVRADFDGASLRIVPLRAGAPPALASDRPVQGSATTPTTAVEYAGEGPWALFVVAALPGAAARLAVSGGEGRYRIEGLGVPVEVAAGERLRVAVPGAAVDLDPAPLRAALRRG